MESRKGNLVERILMILLLCFLFLMKGATVEVDDIFLRACWIVALTDLEKLGTLSSERSATPCLQNYVYWLAAAKQGGRFCKVN